MEYVLICAGVWNLIFAFVKWSLEAGHPFLRFLCFINGSYLIVVGTCSAISPAHREGAFFSFLLSLILTGLLMFTKLRAGKDPVSFLMLCLSGFLIACSLGLMLGAETPEHRLCACAGLNGCVLTLSTPFEKLRNRPGK